MTRVNHHVSPLALPDDGRTDAAPRPHRLLGLRWYGYLALTVALLAVLVLAGGSTPPARDPLDASLDLLTAGERFNLFAWEVDALSGKAADLLQNPAAGLSPEEASTGVRGYIDAARRAGQLEDEIERAFSNPDISAPEEATASQRAELAAIRTQLSQQAGAVEAVLEGQLSQVLGQEGLDTAGIAWPPPRIRLTEPPQLLVVSPRDRIQRLRSLDLEADLDTAGRDRLEQAIGQQDNLSAYVTGIGGYGVYPTMVVDRYGLPWTAETIAHEWVHNYLAFRPLGWAFLDGGQAITMNETVATIVGEELGNVLLRDYYPDLLPPEPADAGNADPPPDDPDRFDFGREMHATRVAVDELLANGYVDEAEAFMEARRQTFVENGYNLRVLNQAYFAFHGSYATGPASTDPIGPKMERLRELSPNLSDFLRIASGLRNVDQLDQALAQQEALHGGAARP